MTLDTTKNYKISLSISVHVLPYMEDDEYVRDVKCFETLPEFKAHALERLDYIKNQIDKLTMKRIKEGVQLL
jgi:hypothetical protein